MNKKYRFSTKQSTQPLPVVSIKKENSEERFARLKSIADATSRRFIHVYLEDERKRQQEDQR